MDAAAAAEPTSPSNTRFGWIDTVVMGQSMCGHLIRAGYKLTVFNRTLSKAQPLRDMGAQLDQTPHAVASQSDVVFSIVGFPSDVRSVLLDPKSGALAGLRPVGVLVDMTTSEPSLAVEISAVATSKGCYSIDAPVSGGDLGAENRNLAIFTGGDESVVRRLSLRPIKHKKNKKQNKKIMITHGAGGHFSYHTWEGYISVFNI